MGLILFALYGAAILAVTLGARRAASGEDSFFVNRRSSSAGLVMFSILASCVGASATIGTVGLAFKVGTPAFWWLGSGAAGLSVLAIFLAGRVRRSQARTLPEMVEQVLGARARRLISALIVVAWLAILAAQFTAMGQVTAALTGLSPLSALFSGALLITAHTIGGGQAAIIRLDRWQGLAMVAGLALTAVWLAGRPGPALAGIRLEVVNESFPVSRLIYFLLILGGSYVVCPMLFGRLLSAADEGAARRGALGAVAGLVLVSALIVFIGLRSRGLIDPATPGDAVLTTVLESVLPGWLAAVIQVALLSAIVSSADSCLVTAGLILAYDLRGRGDVAASRQCLALLAALGLALTFSGRGILNYLLMANDIYVCGVVGPVFITLLQPASRRPHLTLIALAIGSGGLLGLASALTGSHGCGYAGLAASILFTVLSFQRPYFLLDRRLRL
ncbi:MAG: hypothetical protein LBP55_02920 [Candidatus Adiutrix sp.]|jgi:SSS family solute:Na+ symporter|nr:hypothetical protein [Candidatus Adiutrix sp.]